MQDGVLLGPLVSKPQHDKVMRYLEIGKAEAKLVTGGSRPASQNAGYFVEPTIFADVPRDARIWKEEIFGPVLSVTTFKSEDEAVSQLPTTAISALPRPS